MKLIELYLPKYIIYPIFSVLLLIALLATCSHKQEHIKLARKFIKEWNYDRALTEIIAYRGHDDAEIQYLIGFCYLRKNELDEAQTYFQRSLEINPLFKDSIVKIYNTLAKNALRINEPERALSFYQNIAKLVPEYEQANNLFLVGNMNFSNANYPAAVKAYAKALEIDSTSAKAKKARYKYIESLKEIDSLWLALGLADIQYENLKTNAHLLQLSEIKYKIGRKLFDRELYDSAAVFFEQITEHREPKSVLDDTYYYLGEIHLAHNDPAAALEMYKKVLRLNPYEKGDIVQKAKIRIQEIKEKK